MLHEGQCRLGVAGSELELTARQGDASLEQLAVRILLLAPLLDYKVVRSLR